MEKWKEAIEIAKSKLKEIQNDVNDIIVEQAILNDINTQYEITLSYKTIGKDRLSGEKENISLSVLYSLPSFGRIYKTFLINKSDGMFKGFKIFKEA